MNVAPYEFREGINVEKFTSGRYNVERREGSRVALEKLKEYECEGAKLCHSYLAILQPHKLPKLFSTVLFIPPM